MCTRPNSPLVHKARRENRRAADCYRKAPAIIRPQPENRDPEFADAFAELIPRQTRPLRSRSMRVKDPPALIDLCRNNPSGATLDWRGWADPGTRVQRENGLGDVNIVAREASSATTIVTKRCRKRCRRKPSPTSQLLQAKISRAPPSVGTSASPIGTATAVPILGPRESDCRLARGNVLAIWPAAARRASTLYPFPESKILVGRSIRKALDQSEA